MTSTAVARARPAPSGGPMRVAFLAILALWLVLPVVTFGAFGQDGVPYVVAGELSTVDPHAVYASEGGDLYVLDPAFARRSCELSPPGTDCTDVNVAFVSTPVALPIAWALAQLGGDGGIFVLRLLAAACLAGGLWSLGEQLRARRPDADPILAATALLLTPFVVVPLDLAQTSPLLFLSAALGLGRADRSHRWAALISIVWVLAVVLKAWPVALILVLLWQRRWRVLAWSAGWTGLLVLLTLPFSPFTLVGDFLRTSSALNSTAAANPYNGSLEALAHAVAPGLTEGGAATVLLGVRVLLVAVAWWWAARRAAPDSQWAFGYLTLLLVSPFVWRHYLWVPVAAVAVALVDRPRLGREVLALPAVAALTVPIGFIEAWAVGQALFLVAMVGLVAWLVRDGRTASAPRTSAVAA